MANLHRAFALFICLLVLVSYQQRKPRILIIGDSISIGYTPYVKEALSDVALVEHNPGNAQHTGTGIEKIREWIGEEEWDIIQFNWGLWDLAYRHPDATVYGNRDKVNGTITFSVEDYQQNLDSIVRIIRSVSDAKLVFVTTSYVPPEEAGRFRKDPKRYNRAARKVMKKLIVEVNDIYKLSKRIHKQHGRGIDDVHYTPEGSKLLGEEIAHFLRKQLVNHESH